MSKNNAKELTEYISTILEIFDQINSARDGPDDL